MNVQAKSKAVKSTAKDWFLFVIILVLTILLLIIFPDRRHKSVMALWDFSVEMFSIFPAVMILMGLFSAWTSKELVIKYLGKGSGLRGTGLSLFFGALPTGPLYVAFPLAAALRKKGASVSNIAVFLSAWACIKIPQEMVEMQFLGLRFMAARLALTILFVALMGWLVEKIIDRAEGRC